MTRFCRSLPFLLTGPLVLLFAAATFLSIAHGRTEQLAATYTRGNLSVTIPYHSIRSGSGKLVAEIIDPEDHVLGRVERTADIGTGDGSWQPVIQPDKPLPFEDIIWQRLRYRFEYADQSDSCDRGHRVHLADSSPARRAHPRPNGVPCRKQSRDPGHRRRRKQ